MERSDGGGAILGAAAAGLQCLAVRGLRDLGGKQLAAFSAGNDAGVAGNHGGAGAAGERLLLRRLLRRNPDPERYLQYVVEPAAVGRLGARDAIRDIV